MLISGYRERLDRALGETSVEVRVGAETAGTIDGESSGHRSKAG
jgi:hypothetical protein